MKPWVKSTQKKSGVMNLGMGVWEGNVAGLSNI